MYTTSQKKQRHNKKDIQFIPMYRYSILYLLKLQIQLRLKEEDEQCALRMSNLTDDKELSWPSEEKAGIRTKVNHIK